MSGEERGGIRTINLKQKVSLRGQKLKSNYAEKGGPFYFLKKF